ncbi:MAG: hypothetical protein V4552_07265 [Pseudomonadota bacterium]
MRYFRLTHYVIPIILISGCAVAPAKNFYNEVTWSPATLSKNNCPQLSGFYIGDKNLLDIFPTEVISKQFLDPISVITYKQALPVEWNPEGSPKKGEKITPQVSSRIKNIRQKYNEDIEMFYKSASIQIEQSSSLLTLTTISNGTIYEKREFDLQQPGVGCDNGTLYIRYLSASGGGPEARGGSAYASEKLIRKLSTGEIQVEKKLRAWEFSNWTGVGKQYKKPYMATPVLMMFREKQ